MIVWIASLVAGFGYGGVFFLMFAETAILVVPAELIMPLAGFAAGRGQLTLVGIILAGVAGSTLGSIPWYYAGIRVGLPRARALAQRYSRWLTLHPDSIDRFVGWLDRWGGIAVMAGRVIPGVRTVASLVAGIVRLPIPSFIGFSALGATIWVGGLALAGYELGANYTDVAGWLEPASKLLVLLIVLGYAYRVIRQLTLKGDPPSR
ncbi:MAG TPA: DedA family protein [Stellaceae bacterium]|nr:DedA family protein [Stellaceae bacterium]